MAARRPTPPRQGTRRPRVTNSRRQTPAPRVISRAPQPTTGRGQTVRQPVNPFVAHGTLAGMTGHPVPGPAAPAAPAAAAAPVGPQYSLSQLPPDASYDAALALLSRQRDQGLASLQQQRSAGLADYGFNEQWGTGKLVYDPHNPFSKAAELKKSYDTNRRSTAQSMGSGGQLYAGAFQNAQDATFRNQLGAEDSLQKSLINMLARNTQAKTQAGTDFETAAGQAYGDRVGRFQNNPLYDPATGALTSADPASAAQGAASTPAAAAAKPKTKPRGARPKGVGRQSAWSGWYRN